MYIWRHLPDSWYLHSLPSVDFVWNADGCFRLSLQQIIFFNPSFNIVCVLDKKVHFHSWASSFLWLLLINLILPSFPPNICAHHPLAFDIRFHFWVFIIFTFSTVILTFSISTLPLAPGPSNFNFTTATLTFSIFTFTFLVFSSFEGNAVFSFSEEAENVWDSSESKNNLLIHSWHRRYNII